MRSALTATTALPRTMTILRCIPRSSNSSLKAFIDLHDQQVHVPAASAWVMQSSKAMLDRDGNTMRDDDGKIRWLEQVSFVDKETQTRFSDAVIEAVRLAHSDVLADAS
jgi:hypothetical protein